MKALLIALLMFLVTPVSAQKSETWYWARHGDEVIAFTAAGTVNVVFRGGYPFDLKRIDAQTAAVLMVGEAEKRLYILTPDSANPANLYPGSSREWFALLYNVRAVGERYILIWESQYSTRRWQMAASLDLAGKDPYLYDRVTHTIVSLPVQEWLTVRVSQDGERLRFRVQDKLKDVNDTGQRWRLVEYDIVSGVASTVFQRDEDPPSAGASFPESCIPDAYGEKWFCTQYWFAPDGIAYDNEIIRLDGSIEKLRPDQFIRAGLRDQWYILTTRHYEWVLPAELCSADCVFDVTDYDSGETRHYDFSEVEFPPDTRFFLPATQIVDVDNILFIDGLGETYRLDGDGSHEHLGRVECCDSIELSSDDSRYRAFYRFDMEGYQLYDIEAGRILFSKADQGGEPDWDGDYNFIDGGLQFGEYYYSEADSTVFRLKQKLYFFALAILPGEIVLGFLPQMYVSEGEPNGVLLVSPAETIQLIPDAEPIYPHPWW